MKCKRIILAILILCWMITVFMFSNQGSDDSSDTSGGTIAFFLDKLNITKNMSEVERLETIEKYQGPIRKLAHFSIYTLGGILAYSFANQYKTSNKKRILLSWGFCILYAITDEIHQIFIPGRSGELRDVIIDSAGALLGISIWGLFQKVFQQKRNSIH